MRFSVSSTALSNKLGILSKVISPKNSINILECFLFEIESGKLNITASDSANVMKCTLDLYESDSDGAICIQSKNMLSAVKELADQPLYFNVNTEDNSIEVNYQNGSYRIFGQNADEYPRMQALDGQCTSFAMSSETLANNINRTIFATAQDELRLVMTGLYFDLKEDCLAIVATDGHKLVRNRIYSCKSDVPASFILQKKPCALLRSVLAGDGTEVVINFNQTNAEIQFDGGLLYCRLIEGRYPKYDSVIPQDNNNQLTIDRKSLISGLRRVIQFASASTNLIKLSIDFNNLEISAEDIDFATSAHENIACEYNGMPMKIGFKGSVLMDICNNMTSDDIQIDLADPSKAGIISPCEQPEGEDVLMLIMPMLLGE